MSDQPAAKPTGYARGGLLTGPDPTPIYTQTVLALSRCDGYRIPAHALRELGRPGVLKMLNDRAATGPTS